MAGLLGNFLSADDPNALYNGLLSDPGTQRAMAWRNMQAMSGVAGQLAMPTRMPIGIGAVLGQMAGAIPGSEDALMDARLKSMQGQQAAADIGLMRQEGGIAQAFADRLRQVQGGGQP